MVARVAVEGQALDRLAELGLSVEILQKALRRAEAEAATCTAFDPPIMAGFMRYGRTIRFLREDLIAAGWDFDNPRNFCRTIHPTRKFAVVATSGDEGTGDPTLTPTTKYPKGYATVRAVETNGQLALDFPGFQIEDPVSEVEQLSTWFLLYRVTDEEICAEISLPHDMVGGNITDWIERIILPALPREDAALAVVAEPDDDDQGQYVVEVNRR